MSYPECSFNNSIKSYIFGVVCDHPKHDRKSILKYKADAYCNKECPFCHSQIRIQYDSVCAGHGEYYEDLHIHCACGLSFLIRDEKSIDAWNSCARKGGAE